MECTVNRVGDVFFDQIYRTGHQERIEDLDLFANLGIKALRYPVLWERVAPRGLETADWAWSDERLERLRALGIRPIVGLVHHGSGPLTTNLLDPGFPEKLAEYARSVAERYAWVDAYTPINEPLTTARFSGLYGHWYPHQRSHQAFIRVLLTECRAVVLAMRAIRSVNPSAWLVQTDDLGKAYSTPRVSYQADFENERRWLSWDLLCGRIDEHHPLWSHLLAANISEADLHWFEENACPPDILGVNHYLSGQRFLDERMELYPPDSHGGNGVDAYADVLALRVLEEGVAAPADLLCEAWDRYGLPIAITEAHNGCTREEQIRWLVEMWEGAEAARARGADVRALTVWSLLGAYDWDQLVTRGDGHYEPGVFDLRGPRPRPTALATVCRQLGRGEEPDHPTLASPGWWRTPARLFFPPVRLSGDAPDPLQEGPHVKRAPARPLLITGARGTLGRALARACANRGLSHIALSRQDLDAADEDAVGRVLESTHAWGIVNAAGYVRVDQAESERDACYRDNTRAPSALARACAVRGVAFLTFSTDLVFDGRSSRPYVESDAVHPLNQYGTTKAEAEKAVLAVLPAALVIRTSTFFGPWDAYNFAVAVLRAVSAGETFVAASDAVISPTYVPDLVDGCLDLLVDGERGVWHLANEGAMTWLSFAQSVARAAGLSDGCVRGQPTSDFHYPASRPLYSALGSERGLLLPQLASALEHFVRDCDKTLWQAPLLV